MIRAYLYGCSLPISGEAELVNQLRLKNDLRNKLVKLDNDYRDRLDPLVSTPVDAVISGLLEKIRQVSKMIRKMKGEAAYRTVELRMALENFNREYQSAVHVVRGNDIQPIDKLTAKKKKHVAYLLYDDISEVITVTDLKASIRKLYEAMLPLYEEAKQLRRPLWILHKNEINALDEELKTSVSVLLKSARASDAYHCNVDAIGADYRKDHSAAMKKFVRLRFHSFLRGDERGEGYVSVRGSGGYMPDELHGRREVISFPPIENAAWDKTLGRARKQLQWRTVHLLVGGTRSEPQYFDISVCFHRPLPAAANVESIKLIRRRTDVQSRNHHISDHFKYDIVFVLKLPDVALRPNSSTVVRIAFQSKLIDGKLLVANIETSDGIRPFYLDERTISQFSYIESLTGILDRHRDTAIEILAEHREAAPNWFQERTKFVDLWRSHRHLIDLYETLITQRYPGDECVFDALVVFRERFLHVGNIATNTRDQIIARRKYIYRQLASELAKTYSTIVVSDVPPTKPAKADEIVRVESNKRYWRHWGAHSGLKTILSHTAENSGCVFIENKKVAGPAALTAIA